MQNIQFHDWEYDETVFGENAAISIGTDIILTLIANECDDGRGAFDVIDDVRNEIIERGFQPTFLKAKSEAKALALRRLMHIVQN